MTPGAIIAVAAWGAGIFWLCRQIIRDAHETRQASRQIEPWLDPDRAPSAEVLEFPVRPTRNGKDAA